MLICVLFRSNHIFSSNWCFLNFVYLFFLLFVKSMLRVTQIKTYSWDNAQVILVANKSDMVEERVVSTERGKQFAEQLGRCCVYCIFAWNGLHQISLEKQTSSKHSKYFVFHLGNLIVFVVLSCFSVHDKQKHSHQTWLYFSKVLNFLKLQPKKISMSSKFLKGIWIIYLHIVFIRLYWVESTVLKLSCLIATEIILRIFENCEMQKKIDK